MMRQLVLALLVILPLLHGCAAAVVGTAAATGVVVANDRRTTGTMTEDEGIEIKAGNRISSRFPDGIHVNVTSYNRLVLLTGEVPDAATKSEIERIARGVENVRGVFNELAVAGVSSYTVRSNDSVITSKVKTNFLDEGNFNALHVKVVTENSVVYLMGLVKKSEAESATQIARTTSGVQKVVRLFEYID
ncbi:MAG TPA: BON domain-containing protein [Burkholderiales bacterium]|jgi:osmotically-inducible protein OsmY|nr:BON domain-containing protein [Burkholderiales bacterium]